MLRLVLIAALLSLPLHAAAQTPAPGQPPAEPQQPAAPTDRSEAGADVVPLRIGPVTLSGSAWIESIAVAENGHDDVIGTFRVRRARIGLAGNVAPRVGWSITGEFTSQPALRNAFLLFRIADQMNVRVGQATPPTGLERGIPLLQYELIDKSRVNSQLTSNLDPGVTLLNPEPYRGWLSYALSVFNGAGFNRTDDNDGKDTAAKIEITPPALPGLSAVISGSTGEQPEGRRTHSGFGVEYNVDRFRLAVERLRQTNEGGEGKDGFFAMAVYRIRPKTVTPHFRMLELAARYVIFHDPGTGDAAPDEDGGGAAPASTVVPATTREIQSGVNYYVNRNVRVMANLNVPTDTRQTPAATFITRLQLVF